MSNGQFLSRLSLLCGCDIAGEGEMSAQRTRALAAQQPAPAVTDQALRRLSWEQIWDSWEGEAAQQANSGSAMSRSETQLDTTPRRALGWRIGQRPGGSTAAVHAPGGDGSGRMVELLRAQTERWFSLLTEEAAQLRLENAALKADILSSAEAAAAAASGCGKRLQGSSAARLAAPRAQAGIPPITAPLVLDAPRRTSMDGGCGVESPRAVRASEVEPPAPPPASFGAQIFAAIGRISPRGAVAMSDDASEMGEGYSDEEAGFEQHSAQHHTEGMEGCRLAAASCASSMTALSHLLQLRWSLEEEPGSGAATSAHPCGSLPPSRPCSPAPSLSSSAGGIAALTSRTSGAAVSTCGTLGTGFEADDDAGSCVSDVNSCTFGEELRHLASLRDGAAAAAAAVGDALRAGAAPPAPQPAQGAWAAGDAAREAVRALQEGLSKRAADSDVHKWTSQMTVAHAALPGSLEPHESAADGGLARPVCWHAMAGDSAAGASQLSYPSDYWTSPTQLDRALRTLPPPPPPPQEEGSFDEGFVSAEEAPPAPGEPAYGVESDAEAHLSLAAASLAHDSAAAAVAAALKRVSALPSPAELAQACAKEAAHGAEDRLA